MSHYAKIENGIVTQVIVAEADVLHLFPGDWVQTSYNTRGNVHYTPNTTTPSGNVALRGNYAGIGHTYDQTHDVFYAPQPNIANITLNTTTWLWELKGNI
jgi:hypothetical protein